MGKLSIEVNVNEENVPAYGLPSERTNITRFDCILKNTEDESKKFKIESWLNDRGGIGVDLIDANNTKHYGIGRNGKNPESPEQVIAQSLMKKFNAIAAEMQKNVEIYENQKKSKIQETAAQTAASIDALNI